MAALDGDFVVKGQDCERLKDAFNTFLPKDFQCRIRYTHTPPKPSEPLFSPCPGMPPEKTRLASHFLTVSVPLSNDASGSTSDSHVLVFAMEVLIYSSKGLVTMFVSKADSTGYLPQRRPSPIKSIATTFMWWLSTQQRQLTKSMGTKLVISLFARAQSQYLFPGSADHGKKHVLDDRQLIRWWARVLDPLFPIQKTASDSSELGLQGYLTVPGYHGVETKSFFPSKPGSTEKSHNWTSGNPLTELAEARGLPETAPTRCVLPRFPDDPKARFMQDLDDEVGLVEDAGSLALTSPSKQKNGQNAHQDGWWDSSGLSSDLPPTATPSSTPDFEREASPTKQSTSNSQDDSQSSQNSQSSRKSKSKSKNKSKLTPTKARKKLTGPIIPRQPRLKGTSSNLSATSNPEDATRARHDGPFLRQEGYDSAMQILLNLDFATAVAAAHSTSKWVSEVSRMAGLKSKDWALDCVGSAEVEVEAGASVGGAAAPVMNDLGGLVRKKKRKAGEEGGVAAGEGCAEQLALPVEREPATAGVNVLVGRKKAKK
ncbi:hypothetical protein Q7P37_000694 [Cladosporium fusiforme]